MYHPASRCSDDGRQGLAKVATFPWTGWQASSGLGGSFALDWVAGITGIRNFTKVIEYI